MLYDKNGVPYYPGDLIRSHHFTDAADRIWYLYHTVVSRHEQLWAIPVSHLEPSHIDDGGAAPLVGRNHSQVEIISGYGPPPFMTFEDRPRRKDETEAVLNYLDECDGGPADLKDLYYELREAGHSEMALNEAVWKLIDSDQTTVIIERRFKRKDKSGRVGGELEWEERNARLIKLAEKKIRGVLSDAERLEFDLLQTTHFAESRSKYPRTPEDHQLAEIERRLKGERTYNRPEDGSP